MTKAQVHFKKGLPFVLYRKQQDSKVNAILQHSEKLFQTTNFNERGFIFAPFDWDGKKVLIRPDEMDHAEHHFEFKSKKGNRPPTTQNKSDYFELFDKAMNELKSGRFQKVVLSRKIEVASTKTGFGLFENMLVTYPDAFCYLWYHPKIGQWMGATPEMLLSINDSQVQTVSLAGTKKVMPNSNPDWKEKEIEEQRLVTDFIVGCFEDLVSSVKVSEPKSIRAGNLWHLKSTIRGARDSEFNLSDLIQKLHPTPAVCGLPKQDTFRFLKKNEGYEREYYTGFLGELNIENNRNSHLFVNLRCLQIKNGKVFIYVGGGVTEKSKAEQEWVETENKSQTMLQLL